MRSAVAILLVMTAVMMGVLAQDVAQMCKTIKLEQCRQDLKGGSWYQLGDNRCIKAFFYTKHLNFDDAERSCNKYGVGSFKGHLVSINNQEELNKVVCAMYSVHPGKPHYWIGLKHVLLMPPLPPYWIWTDGTGDNFHNWARGQPDNYLLREGCVEMNYWSWGLWNDEACWAERPYMCQVKFY
ncbi:hypothetical protein Q5P01_018937 [Channa striata]|uniref:C-type lectin domain-containing protein n=1 Tax=Channa striata TaxID=64152 RepID=A0AA88M1K8_CHASR|nr:hypothetical protein Q5P01_018937 [Channa striata]